MEVVFISAVISGVVSFFVMRISMLWFKRWIDDFFITQDRWIKSEMEEVLNLVKNLKNSR